MLNKEIVTNFVQFYYQCLNSNNVDALLTHIKSHSVFVRDGGVHHKGPVQIENLLRENCDTGQFMPLKFDFLLNGDRRANFVISGVFSNAHENTQVPFCEYIQFAFGNDKSYWIHSSILQK
jgi:hypothetical protein